MGRAQGLSRKEAGEHILARGVDLRVLKRLERSFARCLHNWSALFDTEILSPANLVSFATQAGIEGTESILRTANRIALGCRVNAVFNSRSSILLFRNHRTGERIPHNLASPQEARLPPDSS
jgi:hypothetical protein